MTLHGQVQGVGLRPAVARLAAELQLAGFVRNSADGVQLHVEGDAAAVDRFQQELPDRLPSIARVAIVDAAPCEASGTESFQIVESESNGPLTTRVPRDLATCSECLRDVLDESNRRFEYPFTSCTNCGPRYSIVDTLPYDRCRTSMAAFEQCTSCLTETVDASERRFHSQTNACPACGPLLTFCRSTADNDAPTSVLRFAAADALKRAAEAVLAGEILALRGVGGYQLIVDATNSAAIARLRDRKRRPSKPLAVMVRSLADADELAVLSQAEIDCLMSRANPIVLLQARSAARVQLSDGIHPGLSELGLLLPTTPLHGLLLDSVGRPLVVTSGNVDGDPLAFEPVAAERVLANVADAWLHHDRPIVRPIDDSVVRVIADRPVTIRNARGLAPLPLPSVERLARQIAASGDHLPIILAVGGQQKNAVALFNGQQAMLAPHLGDLDSLASRERFVEGIDQLLCLYGDPDSAREMSSARAVSSVLHPPFGKVVREEQANGEGASLGQSTIGAVRPLPVRSSRPSLSEGEAECHSGSHDRPTSLIVHDLHPDYFSTHWAARFDHTIAVQHHHAHVVSAMVENDWLDREVLGVAFDGTGYGTDGTVWGGEFLQTTSHGFERVGHLRPFRLPGGETAIREPWRVAAALLVDTVGAEAAFEVLTCGRLGLRPDDHVPDCRAGGPTCCERIGCDVGLALPHDRQKPNGATDGRQVDAVIALAGGDFAPITTSAGRLFDGVAVLILGIERSDFEGQPAMLLESAADISVRDAYDFEVLVGEPLQIDWRPMVQQILADRQQAFLPAVMAAKFHHGLAKVIAKVVRRFELPVVLTGGVFQNRLLTECVLDELAGYPCEVGRHGSIPPNDGGLAAGQLAIGLAMLGLKEESV